MKAGFGLNGAGLPCLDLAWGSEAKADRRAAPRLCRRSVPSLREADPAAVGHRDDPGNVARGATRHEGHLSDDLSSNA